MSRWQDIDFEKILNTPPAEKPNLRQKEQDILNAAVKLFEEKGFDRTSTAELAKTAKVSERTLFKYFPNKTDLLRHLVLPTLLRFMIPHQIMRIRQIFHEQSANPKNLITGFIKDRLDTLEKNGSHIKILVAEITSNPDLRTRFLPFFRNNVFKEILESLEQMQKSGSLRKDVSKENMSRLLIAIALSIAGPKLFFGEKITEKDIEEMGELFSSAISVDYKKP